MEGTILRKLVIIGASGHGKVIADIALKIGYKEIVYLDDNENLLECAGFPVIGKSCRATEIDGDKIVAIGNAKIRERLQSEIKTVTLIHPDAVVSRRVEIGEGSVVMAGTVINSDAIIGNGCIINTGSSIDHDCIIRDFAHISVGAHVAGTCHIGERTWIGAGATVSNNINICSDCIVGAGAVVIKDIDEKGTYVGVPARENKHCK
jgi:sugar O-acyltransferase (sialic acid O-acetyltransferase NeuD family)